MTDHIKYQKIDLPVDYAKSFLELSKTEIKDYFDWFLKIKNERKELLCDYLFSDKEICLCESNLRTIESFLIEIFGTDKQNKKLNSQRQAYNDLESFIKIENGKLNNYAVSICYDIGIYTGELIIHLDKEIRWVIETNKKYADYGQPILMKKGCKLTLNPFRVAKNIAARIADKTNKEDVLQDTFSAWKRGFEVG